MSDFRSLYRHGFVRVAACTLPVVIADPVENARHTTDLARRCSDAGAVIAVFPELGLSGYAIDDLRFQDVLLDEVERAVEGLVKDSVDILSVVVVGAPLRHVNGLFNCAVVIHRGTILGVVPKSYLPNYREFYEARHFVSGAGVRGACITIAGMNVPFGVDLLFEAHDIPGFCMGVEICEDLWVPQPPSTQAALAGASIIVNLSASDITVGKAQTRNMLCQAQSARCVAAYVYAAAGEGESTTDLAWDGQASIFEYGELLAQSERFPQGAEYLCADIDLDLLRQERMRMGTFADCRKQAGRDDWRRIRITLSPPNMNIGFTRVVPRFPFVPADPERLQQDCFEAWTIQVSALRQRLLTSGAKAMVIGISGGLDSTQALLVACRAADELGWDRQSILGYTMPGYGTTDGTKTNALALMHRLGVTAREIDIKPAAQQMFKQMEHPFADGEPQYDITFENVQAGLRTDFLFRLANQHNGLVIGTGDLSELALGWCTYGVGDHMSHYNVNAGLPKTLIQHLIRWLISSGRFGKETGEVLYSILSTEISPELIPSSEAMPVQSTQARIGPYELQDFTLFYVLRYGFRPSKIAFLALQAWQDIEQGAWPPGFHQSDRHAYELPEIRRWLEVFIKRFFGFSQFKRSAVPNGPKVMSGGALSPRGDWRAPSDGNARIWMEELQREVPEG